MPSLALVGQATVRDTTFFFNERGHQHLRLIEINREGSVKILVEEESETFIDHHQKTYFKLLPAIK